jgi:hypothetical protein
MDNPDLEKIIEDYAGAYVKQVVSEAVILIQANPLLSRLAFPSQTCGNRLAAHIQDGDESKLTNIDEVKQELKRLRAELMLADILAAQGYKKRSAK